jgi:hypothetical protein
MLLETIVTPIIKGKSEPDLNVLTILYVDAKGLGSVKESLVFTGHPLVRARHRTTFEVTKEPRLSEKGDCIIGVNANKSGVDFDSSFRKMLSDDLTVVTITIMVDGERFVVKAKGHHALTLSHPEDLVVRTSSYVCSRTLAVQADKAAADIPRQVVSRLRDPDARGYMEILLARV